MRDQPGAVREHERLQPMTAGELESLGYDFVDGAIPSGGEQQNQVVELDPSPLDSEPLRARGRQGAFAVLETAQIAKTEADSRTAKAPWRPRARRGSIKQLDRVQLP